MCDSAEGTAIAAAGHLLENWELVKLDESCSPLDLPASKFSNCLTDCPQQRHCWQDPRDGIPATWRSLKVSRMFRQPFMTNNQLLPTLWQTLKAAWGRADIETAART